MKQILFYSFLVLIGAVFMGVFLTKTDSFDKYSFDKYRVDEVDFLEAKKINLKTHPEGIRFRTVLREGFKNPPSLAGKYVVVTHGCGTSCQTNWIISKETGNIIDQIFTSQGLSYQKDSNLLMAVEEAEFEGQKTSSRYYLIEEDKVTLLEEIKPENTKGQKNDD